jgi:cytochrome c553
MPVADAAHDVLPWAFVLNDPVETTTAPDPDEIVTVPGSALELPRRDINIDNGPPDWHPDAHPPMPEVVATGGGEGVLACGYCHLPNGQGKPENGPVAGQPVAYLVQQMEDEALIGAEYFASMEFRPWIRVVETDSVPETRFAGWIHEVVEDGGMEPIGNRVVEIPEDLARTKLRDDASGFVAYVPRGSVARGEALVRTGGEDGRSVPCTTCHGDDLRGLGPMPALAGRSPSYMARQLYDLKAGNRNGAWSDLMDASVANLTMRDVVDIVAYAASLTP